MKPYLELHVRSHCINSYHNDGDDRDSDEDDPEDDVVADDCGGDGLPVVRHQTEDVSDEAGVGLVWYNEWTVNFSSGWQKSAFVNSIAVLQLSAKKNTRPKTMNRSLLPVQRRRSPRRRAVWLTLPRSCPQEVGCTCKTTVNIR